MAHQARARGRRHLRFLGLGLTGVSLAAEAAPRRAGGADNPDVLLSSGLTGSHRTVPNRLSP